MARVWQTGWEMGSKDWLNLSSSGAVSSANTRGSWSGYAKEQSGYFATAETTIGVAASEFYFGMGLINWGNSHDDEYLLQFKSSTPTAQCGLYANGAGQLQVKNGSGTILGTGPTTLSLNVWYYVEGRVVIDNSAGVFEVRIDGVPELNLTGVDTRNDGSLSTADRIRLPGGASNVTEWSCDDLYINDTTGSVNTGYSGDIRIKSYFPNADGSNSGMSLSTGSNHSALVDERPPNTTDYIYGTGTTETDSLNIPNTVDVTTVQAVSVWLYAQKSDAGAGNIAHVLKSGGTTDIGSDTALSTGWTYYSKIYNQNPNGPANWTPAAVDAMEIGAKSR